MEDLLSGDPSITYPITLYLREVGDTNSHIVSANYNGSTEYVLNIKSEKALHMKTYSMHWT